MVTEIGKFLRILRISRDETSKHMAENLEISPAYLSAIELGKRSVPENFENLIIEKYMLNEKNQEKLKKAIDDSTLSLKIDFSNSSEKKKELLLTMAKEDLDNEVIDKICQIIKKNKK